MTHTEYLRKDLYSTVKKFKNKHNLKAISRLKTLQLYNLIGSDKDIHLNINKKTTDITYKVTMPVSVLDNYTRLTVKVFKRSDLDAYLPISQFKF